MAVLPGSLDYLYYNGILDHIPYEAYEMGPMTASGRAQMSGLGTGFSLNPAMKANSVNAYSQMNGTQYLQNAQQGLLYNTYNSPDTFVPRNYSYKDGEGYSLAQKALNEEGAYGIDQDFEVMAVGQDGKNLRLAIEDAAAKTKETVSNSPNWVKGLLAAGITVGTLCCLFFRGGKKPVKVQSSSNLTLFQKIKNLFK